MKAVMSQMPSDGRCQWGRWTGGSLAAARLRRRGSVTIEAIVVIPLLAIVTFAAFQFAGTIAVEQAVSYAAVVGARESGKDATDAEIQATVQNALAPFQIVLGSNASVLIERFGSANSQIGTHVLTAPAPALSNDETRVTVGVSLSVAPLSNLLASFGLNFSNRKFQTSSLVRFSG